MLRRAALPLSVLFLYACGPSNRDDGNGIGKTDAGPADAPCETSISGKVFAPNGTLPLSNVLVYVPETMPVAFPEGVQCQACSDSIPGGALSSAISGLDGSFKLVGVPPGENIPVIITTGKWRRRLTVPVVGQCVDLPVADGEFRLPRNRTEGEIPRIAMVTGGFDSLACIFSKLGIDASEFGDSSNDPQRVVWYQGHGGQQPGSPQPSAALWGNLTELSKFDMVINSCESNTYEAEKSPPVMDPDVLRQYADMGGRVFGSHYHYIWATDLIPQWHGTAMWGSSGFSGSTPDLVDTSHNDGMNFATWLQNVGASTVFGQVPLNDTITNVGPVIPPTTRWLYASGTNPATHYLSFRTPVGAEEKDQCGKVVYAGMHINHADSTVNASFPSGCSAGLTPDEKALIYLLFDLGACNNPIF